MTAPKTAKYRLYWGVVWLEKPKNFKGKVCSAPL